MQALFGSTDVAYVAVGQSLFVENTWSMTRTDGLSLCLIADVSTDDVFSH